MKKLFVAALVLLAIPCHVVEAQYVQKMDFQLRSYLARQHQAGEMVDLFIHGNEDAVGSAVGAHGGFVKMSRPNLVNARVPVDKVAQLATVPAVHHFEFSLDRGELMNDSMRVKNRVNWVHEGRAPLGQSYDGDEVIMGYIDTGLDIMHPDFRDAENNTRVIRYWDQRRPSGPSSPAPFNYGQEWTGAQLDAGGDIPVDDGTGHGTTVAGTGSGNGLANGRHKGVAPESDIVMVATDFSAPNWRATVADGVAYILSVAEAAGKPVVINASLGSYAGSHDGQDAAALFIEELLEEQGGRAMVSAAGNKNAEYPFHLRTDVDQDTSFTWFTTNQNGAPYNIFPFPNMYFELWSDAADFANVRFAIGADRVSPSLAYRGRTPFHNVAEAIGTTVTEPLLSLDGNLLGTVQYYAQERGNQILLQVFMQAPDSAAHLWRFMTTGSGNFDVWTLTTVTATSNVIGPVLAAPLSLPFPTPAEYPAMANYVQPDNNSHMVDSWACLSNVLTVANYCNEVTYTDYFGVERTVPGEEQNIAPNSSAGPTRDQRQKPDIASTGDITFTAAPLDAIQWIIDNQVGFKVDPGGMHVRNGGTSMASPVVAGSVALYLQRCPTATTQELGAAVRRTARPDAFTGTVPNIRWGFGKLDTYTMLLSNAQLQVTTPELCEGETSVVSAPAGFTVTEWSDGSTGASLEVSTSLDVSAMLVSDAGCTVFSDTISFQVLEIPLMPVISVEGSTLTSSAGPAYQWYLDGSALEGEVGQVLVAELSGSYTVEFIGENGCATLSDAVQVIIVGVAENRTGSFAVWPNPAQDQLLVRFPEGSIGPKMITVIAGNGKVVRRERVNKDGRIDIDISSLAAGSYTVKAEAGIDRWSQRFVKLP